MTDPTKSTDPTPTYVRYRDDLEQRRPDEDELIDKITSALHCNNQHAYKKYKHGIRDAHAKSHAVLRGELTVYPDLPEPLRQGLFATPARYPVIARFSTTAGAIRSDQIRGVRGLGIKVLGVHGQKALPDDDATTQDFILVTHREFPFADVHAYYTKGMPLAWLLARLPDAALRLISDALAGVGARLARVGRSLPTTLAVFNQANTHILGETYYSSAPLRYGDYVAKLCVTPLSAPWWPCRASRCPATRARTLTATWFPASSPATAPTMSCGCNCAPTRSRCRSRTPACRGRSQRRRTAASRKSASPPKTPTARRGGPTATTCCRSTRGEPWQITAPWDPSTD